MKKKHIKYVVGIVLVTVFYLPYSHMAGQLKGAETLNQMLLSVTCRDKAAFEQSLNLLPPPSSTSEFALPGENKELWGEMRKQTLKMCDDLKLYR